VKRWISQRGGLTPHMIFLRGRQLQTMYKPCFLDAQASASKLPAQATRTSGPGPAPAANASSR